MTLHLFGIEQRNGPPWGAPLIISLPAKFLRCPLYLPYEKDKQRGEPDEEMILF